MLFEYPTVPWRGDTVRSLALHLTNDAAASDDEELDDVGPSSAVTAAFLAAVQAHPHRVACEDGNESRTYLQLHRFSVAAGNLIYDGFFSA
eukprot:Skav212543  [mRNA]  locus=scaffold1851:469340:469766:+ [translate_table: standard]